MLETLKIASLVTVSVHQYSSMPIPHVSNKYIPDHILLIFLDLGGFVVLHERVDFIGVEHAVGNFTGVTL